MDLLQRLHAATYDRLSAPVEPKLAPYRARVAGQATGDVLEIGGGTGANLRYYPWDARLTILEPNPHMARRLREKATHQERRVNIIEQAGERLPFPDANFDTVVASLVLCSVADPAKVVSEIRRVLRPGGTFAFHEHVAAADPGLRRWQHLTNHIWTPLAGGCRLDRPTVEIIRAAGFREVTLEEIEVPIGLPLTRSQIVGRATI